MRNAFDPSTPGESTADSDGDGLDNLEEQEARTDANGDTDKDDLSDGDERDRGTNPRVSDTDGDNIWDGGEVDYYGTDPLDPLGDADGDGLSDAIEIGVDYSTNPRLADTDGDGLDDPTEVGVNLNPNDESDATADYDGDGLVNADEVGRGTSFHAEDTDVDGLPDGDEVTRGLEKSLRADTDRGGLPDGDEVIDGTDPFDPADDLVSCHPICEGGGPLHAACDPCAALICSWDTYCCGSAWDEFCVEQVSTVCD